MSSLLTQGLSSSTSKSSATDWRSVIGHRLIGRYDLIPTSPRTVEAEIGLRLGGRHAYWFVSRVDTLYGRVLMVWRPAASASSRDLLVAPFDTGGFWHGHIATTRQFGGSDKQEFVSSWSLSLMDALPLFCDWVNDVFVSKFEYVSGAAVPDYVVHDHVDPSVNHSLAWSWETRSATSKELTGDLVLDAIFWQEDDLLSMRAYVQQYLPAAAVRPTLALLASVSRRDSTVSLSMQSARAYVADALEDFCRG